MRVLALGLVLVVAGCGTLPAVNGAPVGGNLPEHCAWVQEQVSNGSMPVAIAEQHYGYCGPFQPVLESEHLKRWK